MSTLCRAVYHVWAGHGESAIARRRNRWSALALRYMQLGLQLPNAFCIVKLQTFKTFFKIPQKSQDHTVKGGQYTAQGTIKTIF